MRHSVHADALYRQIKEVLEDFGLRFHEMSELQMEFGEEFVTFKTRCGKKQFVYSYVEVNAKTEAK